MTFEEHANLIVREHSPYGAITATGTTLVKAITTALTRATEAARQEERARLQHAVRQVVIDELPGADTTLERILAAFRQPPPAQG